MCGINGIIFHKQNHSTKVKEQLAMMNDLIIHRGPDDDGVYADDGFHYSVGMAMRRLSIIDLFSGHQPLISEDQNLVIVFNGEIYNFKLLKEKMQQDGAEFRTSSDTEVVLRLYEKHGTAAFSLLDGMFAFSIYDKRKNKIFIARDFFGEKPLYYYPGSDQFLFSSELKSIIGILKSKPEISISGLNLFFSLTYIPAPFTIYEQIFKLEPYHFIEFDLEKFQYTIKKIENNSPVDQSVLSFKEAVQEVKQRVYNSVCSRTVADVPIGTFLSGGVDSSIVSLCVSQMTSAKIDTFSIGFEKTEFDESSKARSVAKIIRSNHHEFIVNASMMKNNIDEIIFNFDEPFADSSALATYLVSNKTRDFVKVALTGDGGDEVFGGYNKYYIGYLNNKYTSFIPHYLHNNIVSVIKRLIRIKEDNRGIRFKLSKLLNAVNYDDNFYWDIISLANNEQELSGILRKEYLEHDIFINYKRVSDLYNPKTLTDFRQIDKFMSLEGDMLVKVDRTSMMSSLECRAPFLNKSLWEFTNSLPERFLIKGWKKKYILKEAFKEYFPDGFLDKPKKGFGVPVGDWLRSDLNVELKHYIDEKLLNSQEIFNVGEIRKLVMEHISGARDNTFKVWTFFCFQKWYFNTYTKN